MKQNVGGVYLPHAYETARNQRKYIPQTIK